MAAGSGKVEVSSLWTDPGTTAKQDHLQAGRFLVDVARKPVPLAMAAPGMH